MMEYTVTNDIKKATHWMSKPDSKSCVKEFIIPNKAYKLIRRNGTWDEGMESESEIFIRSEDGCLSLYYLCHKGVFIIQDVQ